MRFVIVTGMSGAGKTQAVRSLEDLGYFCVDNLPPKLIPKFAEACVQSQGKIDKVALVIDIRGGIFFDDLFEGLERLEQDGYRYEILFLEASDESLIKRFKETRRVHPLSPEGRIIDGIYEERKKLERLKDKAHKIIDTSDMTSAQLKGKIKKFYLEEGESNNIVISILSFGFKKGIPLDGDLVFDVRFLPNPHYIEELKEFTGNDKNIREYVMQWPESIEFVKKLNDMIDFLIPFYVREGKMQLVIGIGCTGGKHRSVTVANTLYEYLKDKGHKVTINHRDIPDKK